MQAVEPTRNSRATPTQTGKVMATFEAGKNIGKCLPRPLDHVHLYASFTLE